MIGAERDSANAKPPVHVVLVAEVKCYLCGTTEGWLELEPGKALGYRPHGEAVAQVIRRILPIRCARCGGATFLDDVECIKRREEVSPGSWERPRRGWGAKAASRSARRQPAGGRGDLRRAVGTGAELAELNSKRMQMSYLSVRERSCANA
jgi:hypothetical protein